MTYVEFFDKEAVENICACLTYIPDRVIYIGYETDGERKVLDRHIAKYSELFKGRGHNIEFIPKHIIKNNLENAVNLLTEIVEEYDDCAFDITGGDEYLVLALGIVYAKYPQKNIQIHTFNLRNNTVFDCDKDGATIYRDTPTLSIDENIRLHGGEVAYGTVDEQYTYKWDLSSDFMRDIRLMWDICSDDIRYWSTRITALKAIEEVGKISDDGLTVVFSSEAVLQKLGKHKKNYAKAIKLIPRLRECGLVTDFDDSDETAVRITYKNKQVKKCLTKEGQVLEMKVYITAIQVNDGNGEPVYDDVKNGVLIDWDGTFHDEDTEDIYDTENEIDVMMMHDAVPVFVSCKSGDFTAEELYKLNTVATRFGGKYAKKVLVAPTLSTMGEAGKYLRQRIKDMQICLVENEVYYESQFAKKISRLWKE